MKKMNYKFTALYSIAAGLLLTGCMTQRENVVVASSPSKVIVKDTYDGKERLFYSRDSRFNGLEKGDTIYVYRNLLAKHKYHDNMIFNDESKELHINPKSIQWAIEDRKALQNQMSNECRMKQK